MSTTPVMELVSVSKTFAGVQALAGVSLPVHAGEVTCLLGDNGAGKSTLIKIMSGVHGPTSGRILVDGQVAHFHAPRDAQEQGIATVHQDVDTFPLMSVARNFFLGREPTKGWGPLRRLDKQQAATIAIEQLHAFGIRRVTSADQPVGTMSGGERQALAISRALYFGARLLILDEPTAALGVKEAGVVLRLVRQAKSRGVAIVFITHNAHHAITIGDRFTVLIHGAVAAQFARGERSREDMLNLMAGGEELESLQVELEALDETSTA
jgi:simple sugar transport system ATP-binding protein